ncbi:HAMP domain-containing sensor histidine kinase [uncultured Flavobacterium sp.]|uniref:sensor histidine kinase n=1 Tax=uncultured Flavobacterium sp. TaxID=165435 RepID=UPI0030EBFD7A
MPSFSYRNRIAFYYIITTALLISVVFTVIYISVKESVYRDIENNITLEKIKLLDEISIFDKGFILLDQHEWKEKEHNTLDVNPIFIQFANTEGKMFDKSPNLKNSQLIFHTSDEGLPLYFDAKLNQIAIRQSQIHVTYKGKVVGYLIIAMSLEDANLVLRNLRYTLLLAFPLVLGILFLVARFIVGRSIEPVKTIIETSNKITKDNLNTRISLPENKDELYELSDTINNLLNRIENAIEREKQFTSDASHELRTPLAIIKGTLEVLIRKPREKQEYEDKINFCISEVDRVNKLVDELLLLARFENEKQNIKSESVLLNALLLDTSARFSEKINGKQCKISNQFEDEVYVQSDYSLVSIILSNILSNALKYSYENSTITLKIYIENNTIKCSITDQGIGISEEDKDKIFNAFFRSESLNHPDIKGTGLGLSIVKRLCELLNITINIESELNKGTTIVLSFPEEEIK